MKTTEEYGTTPAPPGQVWVCGACGKTSSTKYGISGPRSRGWDEACVLNAVLCYSNPDPLTGEWKIVPPLNTTP